MDRPASRPRARYTAPQAPLDFSPRHSPVALQLDADSVFATQASISRHTDRLLAIATATRHLSITIKGSSANRQRLTCHLRESLDGAGAILAMRTEPPVVTDVMPRCPLLAPERGCCEWSESRLIVPSESAWFPARLDLTDFLRDGGVIDRVRLGAAVDDIVDAAESSIDTARWPTPGMQQDAWMNRRLAVSVTGYPQLHDRLLYTTSALHQVTGWLSARLQSRSMWHAARRRPLPAILGADPTRGMPLGGFRDEWLRRWQGAVDSTAVRHRNLLAIEVDALVYRDANAGRLNVDLLPLAIHADVIAVACSMEMDHSESQALESRLRASLQQRRALDQIAKHI